MRAVRSYHWADMPNWGDRLAPLLLKRFTGLSSKWAPVHRAQVITVGSVLEHVPPLWEGYILGAGKLYPESRLHLYTATMTILGLRGPYSASGVKGNFALGDPGLLASELVPTPIPVYDLGVVPHWSDPHLADRYAAWHPVVIDPAGDPLTAVSQISRCRKIVTSSLHGMIVADSFCIPRRVFLAPSMANEGGAFKFRDYSASLNMPFEEGKLAEANRFHVEDRRFELFDAYRALEQGLRR